MITFMGYAQQVTHGGDGSRLELLVKDSPADLGQAIGLMPLKNQVLAVRVLLGSGSEEVTHFQASIAPIMTALVFRAHTAKVKLDVPESDALRSALLLSYQESALTFQITPEGERPAKGKVSKGDYGQFWRALIVAGFMNHTDMLEVFHDLREGAGRDGFNDEQVLRDCFRVVSRAEVGPDQLKSWLQHRLPPQSGVWMLIEQAEGR